MPTKNAAKTGSDLSAYRAPEDEARKPGEGDEPITPPVGEADAPRPAQTDAGDGIEADQQPAPKPVPRPGSNDDARNRISDRFAKKRAGETSEFDGDLTKPANLLGDLGKERPAEPPDDPPVEGAEGGDDTKAPAKPGPSDSKGDDAGAETPPKPDKMVLVVNGKTVRKSLDEVAALAEMTPEEVASDPARAKRYAQKELATTENLKESKNTRRETPSRGSDEPAQPGRRAPNQERQPAGEDDDVSDQPSHVADDTSDDEVTKLIEDIQLGDPKEVGPKLKQFLEKTAEKKSVETVEARQGDHAVTRDRESTATALRGFIDDHPEVVGKTTVSVAMSAALVDEYREDVIKAMIAEGQDADEAEEIVRSANPADVANAHQRRRIAGDPNVRQIDKGMMEKAYERVKSEFGAAPQTQQQQQGFAEQRQQRKASLTPQPRSASVPPATPPTPKAPLTRSSVVADMRKMRGQKTAPSVR